jgi:septal ring factor EnvC (AmiA/AmiB activator)
VPDEPTLGEVSRQIASLARTVEQLAGKVLTVEVWRAERELIETRLRENEKDISDAIADAKSEREKRERERHELQVQAAAHRRTTILALITAFVAPVVTGIVLVLILGS